MWDGALGTCAIHDTRPKVCRDYVPGSSEFCPHHKGHRC
jgi:Fe-S-cluster containining protein